MNRDKIKVAIVDDDESFACALERRFRVSGFEVCTYPSAEGFLAPTMLRQCDCLILDFHLGGMSGLDLQRRLGELGVRTPIIIVTASDSPVLRKEAEEAGCAAFFLKPVPTQLLIDAITGAVGKTMRKNGEGHL
jgi:FixJ family two-component response regulator